MPPIGSRCKVGQLARLDNGSGCDGLAHADALHRLARAVHDLDEGSGPADR